MRRLLISQASLDLVAPTEWKAFCQLVRPKFRSYVTPDLVKWLLDHPEQGQLPTKVIHVTNQERRFARRLYNALAVISLLLLHRPLFI